MSDFPAEPPRLILASSSPYRRELLERLRVPFEVSSPSIDETPLPGEAPAATAMRLAELKARAVAERAASEGATNAAAGPRALFVIGSDQVATFDGRQIGKPGTHDKALAQLQAMRGRTVEFHSALCLLDATRDTAQTEDVVTRVRFRDLPDAQLDAYLRAETPYDVAGSAKSEGLGIALVEAIESDDPTALVGLPLIALTRMLRAAGYPLLGGAR
ncbi:Maf-like protein [Trinickia caryophylli]|uniref:7-methyl-GTP pyrophosphatase n=1 Tax=Trinickia caryophylli TaxID=28094 RepID=A0A1X7DV97_TRICW|nr:Maf-like protein [Trinickia caryophylli]PMS09226.1 septum formation protein Maf [Trinickia caryophylli]TRX18000.1 septum formation protein Maf [Trinickia caryophylli]WQE11221.1 Maf-like protein [Trinickia caryophylli]SMF21915.1 septum formation protein [Trinickia caryophylli]GLU32366.1 Maf-like protein [Trinickia caryophylli]